MNNNKILDLISEAYEYIHEVVKYGDLDESDKDILQNAEQALAEAERELNEEN